MISVILPDELYLLSLTHLELTCRIARTAFPYRTSPPVSFIKIKNSRFKHQLFFHKNKKIIFNQVNKFKILKFRLKSIKKKKEVIECNWD